MNKLKIGLLPLYLELYDKCCDHMRPRVEEFRNVIIKELEKKDLEVKAAQICRIKSEFSEAVAYFEEERVDAIVTLHLAYSPSLEYTDVLMETTLPLIVLDTTPAYEFGSDQDKMEIEYNHGIHGVQDMCNLLLQRNRVFFLMVGHWRESDVLERVVKCVRAARLASNMRKSRVGKLGNSFNGMGDFYVTASELKSGLGIETIQYDSYIGRRILNSLSKDEIRLEMDNNILNFNCDGIKEEVHRSTAESCLVIRKWIERERLTAFTANFLSINEDIGLPCMPFLEASKAMSRGIGYAGEGDVLTAALVGALASVYPETTFTEMFCPDWKNNSIFLSHMGEINLKLAASRPVMSEFDFVYTNAKNPAVAYTGLKAGRAVLVNLAPTGDGMYSLIVAPVTVLEPDGENKLKMSINGWVRPYMTIQQFLEKFSLSGGSHHSALVYGQVEDEIIMFGHMMKGITKVIKI